MDFELMDEHKNTTVRSKPFPASKADSEELMRQITTYALQPTLQKNMSKQSIQNTASHASW